MTVISWLLRLESRGLFILISYGFNIIVHLVEIKHESVQSAEPFLLIPLNFSMIAETSAQLGI